MLNQADFILGERRKLTMQVNIQTDAEYPITQATYTLTHSSGTKEAEDVNCVIDNVNHRFSAIIEPKLKGRYTMMWTYVISDEIIKKEMPVSVT